MQRPTLFALVLASGLLATSMTSGQKEEPTARWPQFRGVDGLGLVADATPLPTAFGPKKNVHWHQAIPTGHSSPCIWGNHLVLTAYHKADKKLETICLDRATGKDLWRKTAPIKGIEHTHQISSPATPTPCTDGERIYVYFGSYGLLCYDWDGALVWDHPLPTPKTRFGTGASPVLVDDLVVLSCDFLPKPYLLAVDRKTGKEVWKKERLPTPDEGYATPLVWRHDGTEEIILHTSVRISAFSPRDGKELWWVGVKSTAGSTPVAGAGKLYVSTWTHGGEAEDRVTLPAFDELLKKYDKDNDGKLSMEEFPRDLSMLKRKAVGDIPGADIKLIWFFKEMDKNGDGKIDAFEWSLVKLYFGLNPQHGVLAIKPGGQGDVGRTHVVWREKKSIPEISSPLYYDGFVYLVREGGLVTCLEAASGKVIYRQRLNAEGAYFASPVAGDGKIYACSYDGVVTVFRAGKKFEILSQTDFGEHIMATPALADGHIYLRTEKHLYAFGK